MLILPSGYTRKAMHQNRTRFPTFINKIQTNFQRIQQILALHISQRHSHSHELQIMPCILQHIKNLLRAQCTFIRPVTLQILIFTRPINVHRPNLFRRNRKTRLPFGEKPDRSRAQNR
ncbi:hypothetical protein Hanom_Chr01g00035081 [Helianthus anomalus]